MHSFKTTLIEKIFLLFNYHSAFVGFMFFLIGLFFLITFSTKTDFEFFVYHIYETAQTDGIITKKEKTNTSINERMVMNIYYSFQLNDSTILGNSFSSLKKHNINERTQIQYLVKNPKQSRILNTSDAPFQLWITFFILIFPVIGFYMLFKSYKKASEIIFILENFNSTIAHLEHTIKTDVEINDQAIYKLSYNYNYKELQHLNLTETLSPEKFKETEKLLISNYDNSKSILVNKLPVDIRIKIKKIIQKK